MKIAKRTLRVTKKRLEEFFGLPEGVEIIAVRHAKNMGEEFEFLLVSAGEVMLNDERKLTFYQDDEYGCYRAISLDKLQEGLGKNIKIETTGGIFVGSEGLERLKLTNQGMDVNNSDKIVFSGGEVIIPLDTTRTHPKTEEKVNSSDLVNNILNKLKDGGAL
ncbi:hypothetical protein AB3N02_22220 [Priestia aryabhattai]|uniref:hypothetical protein n=1 Tax=Priestia aryabhattai TaxID=412384 RepID=UPI0039A07CE6